MSSPNPLKHVINTLSKPLKRVINTLSKPLKTCN